MDYGLVIISHETDKTFTDESGKQFNKIVPTLDKRANNICARMCDIVGYSRTVTDADGNLSTKLFMRGTPRYEAGSRFKYTPDYIDFSYKNLVEAISDAIDKQATEDGEEYFTDTRSNAYADTTEDYVLKSSIHLLIITHPMFLSPSTNPALFKLPINILVEGRK